MTRAEECKALLERLDAGANHQGFPEEFGHSWTKLCADAATKIRRLAAQADAQGPLTREQIATAVRKALVEDWRNADTCESWVEDILLTGCRKAGGGYGYQKPEEAAQNLALDAADAILAIPTPPLSGEPQRAGVQDTRPIARSSSLQHHTGDGE